MKNQHLVLLAVAAFAGLQPETKAQAVIDLGSASSFAVLAGTTITDSIATANTTLVTGDIGATGVITGGAAFNFISGANHGADSSTQAAQTALATAYGIAVGRTPTTTYPAIYDFGTQTLTPGVYNDPSSFSIATSALTLDAGGNPNAVWIFQAGSTLNTTKNISLINSANAANVFWQITSSATIGANTSFSGTVLALVDITFGANSTLDGRLLAQTGAVTLGGNNNISVPTAAVPEPATTALIAAFCTLGLAVWYRRRACS